ncbi:MAG: cyclohexanone monooxygenase, partial [Actinomycetia bacterium]|nr:cyclohexanone monooxygenase [Actinomycetes bacterium]
VAAELTVFQRTATYAVPARNRPLDPETVAAVKADYRAIRQRQRAMPGGIGAALPGPAVSAMSLDDDERIRLTERAWDHGGFAFPTTFNDTMVDPRANHLLAEFVRDKIRGVVRDPETAEKLCPKHLISCKRLCLESGYYESFNRPNVRLIALGERGIERITRTAVIVDGERHELDALIMATGFDAMTGSLLAVDIVGRDGVLLNDTWASGPVTYLGLGVPGFPNLFSVSGPGSPSVLTNMVLAAEQHIDWIADCLVFLRDTGRRTVEATPEAARDWVDHVNAVANRTLYPTCNSWYLGANVPGKPRVFMPLLGFPPYEERCNAVAAADYEGFEIA